MRVILEAGSNHYLLPVSVRTDVTEALAALVDGARHVQQGYSHKGGFVDYGPAGLRLILVSEYELNAPTKVASGEEEDL